MLPRKGKDFELKLGKLGLTVFVLGMSLALLGVFAFGVKVGKDIDSYPAKIVGIIPGLQGKVLGGTENQDKKTEAAGEKGNFKLGFYESLSGKKADSPDDMHEPPPPPLKDGAVPESTVPGAAQPRAPGTNAAQASPQSAAKPGAKPEAAPRKAEEPKPPEARKSESGGKYFIQVAALNSEAKAKELKAKLGKLGYSPRLETVNKKGKGKVYRIRMMGYATEQEAAKIMAKLEKQVPGTKCLIHKGSE